MTALPTCSRNVAYLCLSIPPAPTFARRRPSLPTADKCLPASRKCARYFPTFDRPPPARRH
eukprot:14814785-Alexandrium_andersonii.AAC.1